MNRSDVMRISRTVLWVVGCISGIGLLAVLGLVCLLGVASIIPGAHDYKTELPNGYFLLREYSGALLIFQDRDGDHTWDPRTQQVGPSRYGILMAVRGRYVLGNLDTEERAFKVSEVPDRYFIIDTLSDTIAAELSFQEYEKEMHELGFNDLPELIRPNKLTRFLPE